MKLTHTEIATVIEYALQRLRQGWSDAQVMQDAANVLRTGGRQCIHECDAVARATIAGYRAAEGEGK